MHLSLSNEIQQQNCETPILSNILYKTHDHMCNFHAQNEENPGTKPFLFSFLPEEPLSNSETSLC